MPNERRGFRKLTKSTALPPNERMDFTVSYEKQQKAVHKYRNPQGRLGLNMPDNIIQHGC